MRRNFRFPGVSPKVGYHAFGVISYALSLSMASSGEIPPSKSSANMPCPIQFLLERGPLNKEEVQELPRWIQSIKSSILFTKTGSS